MVVGGYGTVSPEAEVDLVPEVSGKVVSINPQLKAGGFIGAGEQILQIEPRDYELAVQGAQAAVANAQLKLQIEYEEAELARRDWNELHPNTEPNSPLVFRRPQIQQARAALQSAEAQLATAELKLERTSLSLPFDGMVVRETVDLGQYINAGQPIGRIYSIEAVEIEVPLEDWELAWFNIPPNPVSINGHNSSSAGSQVEVRSKFAGGEHVWEGQVMLTTGQVDRTSRMVSVVIEVAEPFKGANGRPPLVPGMFVEALIKGRVLENAVAVPRDAMHEGNRVWAVEYSRGHIKPVKMMRLGGNFAAALMGGDPVGGIVSLPQQMAYTLGEEWIISYDRLGDERLTRARLARLFARAAVGDDLLEVLSELAQRVVYEVWVVNNGRLHIRPLEIARADKEFAYATSGLEDGAMIIVSSLDTVTEAMRVRTGTGESAEKTSE
jgi:RND family efflux transporter MFP subunit